MPTPTRLTLRLYHSLWAGLDWLYPPVCAGCGAAGDRWCADCRNNARLCAPPLCPLCGQSQTHDSLCYNCRKHRPHYTGLRSWAFFEGPLREAIHKLKYKRDITLGDVLAKPLIQTLDTLGWRFDYVAPVPLAAGRLRERGYNQSAFLARPIAIAFDVPLSSKCMWRVRETHSQVGLSAEERIKNVAEAFAASPEIVRAKDVLVVDDVTTTGATLDACAAALRNAGAKNVYGLTLARAALV